MSDAKLKEAFDEWWYSEGSGMPLLKGEDAETHAHRVSYSAWMNGAFVATGKGGDK